MKNGLSHGFLSPQWSAASYVQRPATTAPRLANALSSHALSSPVASPYSVSSYDHGPPNTQLCNGSPPVPSPLPGPSSGAAT